MHSMLSVFAESLDLSQVKEQGTQSIPYIITLPKNTQS